MDTILASQAGECNGNVRKGPIRSSFATKLLARRSAVVAAIAASDEGAAGAAGLGISTKYAGTFSDEKGKKTFKYQYVTRKDGTKVPVQSYDQDAADLELWMLKACSRNILWSFEDRAKKTKCEYQEIFWYQDIATRKYHCRPLRDPYSPSTGYEDEFDRSVRFKLHEARFSRKDMATGEILDAPVMRKAPVFRVVNCTRSKISKKVHPEIWYSDKSERASFHNVQVCGSVWTCPTCSRKINLRRQEQIKTAYDLFSELPEYDVLMVTFTIKHGFTDLLADTLEKLKLADRGHLQKSYFYETLRGKSRTLKGVKVKIPSKYSFVGKISATEMTHGSNGWHPHLHQLFFFERKLIQKEIEEIRKSLFIEWKKACLSVGLDAPLEFKMVTGDDGKKYRKYLGVDVRRALSAADYLTKFGVERKWGPEKEMAAANRKKSRDDRSGLTPFQILEKASMGHERSIDLYRDYALATLGRHQIEMTPGLRTRLKEMGIKDLDKTDEEIALETQEDSRVLGELTDDDYERLCCLENVVAYQDIEPFGMVLRITKLEGFDAAVRWIRSLPRRSVSGDDYDY